MRLVNILFKEASLRFIATIIIVIIIIYVIYDKCRLTLSSNNKKWAVNVRITLNILSGKNIFSFGGHLTKVMKVGILRICFFLIIYLCLFSFTLTFSRQNLCTLQTRLRGEKWVGKSYTIRKYTMIVIKMRTNQCLCLKCDLHPLCRYIIVLGKIISHYNRMMRMCSCLEKKAK